jgi:hypothetical protein
MKPLVLPTMSQEQTRKRSVSEESSSNKKQKSTTEDMSETKKIPQSPSLGAGISLSDDERKAPIPNSVFSYSEGQTTKAPLQVDVLMGRGRPCQKHFGNLRLLKIVENDRARYLAAPREERRAIAGAVCDLVGNCGARFLKSVGDHWEVVPRRVALDKVSHALRDKKVNQDEKRHRENLQETEAALSGVRELARELGFVRASARIPPVEYPPQGWSPYPNGMPFPYGAGMMMPNHFAHPHPMGRPAVYEHAADQLMRAQMAASIMSQGGQMEQMGGGVVQRDHQN